MVVRAPASGVHEYERKQLLERVRREGATVGTQLPETVTLDGEDFELREFVLAVRRRDTVPDAERERVETLKTMLRRERSARIERLESASLSYEAGERLADSIVGIDRALAALGELDPADVEAEREAAKAADHKRWTRFLQKALGHDGKRGDRRADGGSGR